MPQRLRDSDVIAYTTGNTMGFSDEFFNTGPFASGPFGDFTTVPPGFVAEGDRADPVRVELSGSLKLPTGHSFSLELS
jgi:hypothetical protein